MFSVQTRGLQEGDEREESFCVRSARLRYAEQSSRVLVPPLIIESYFRRSWVCVWMYKYYRASSSCGKQRLLASSAPGERNLLLRKHGNECWCRADRGKRIQDKFGNAF